MMRVRETGIQSRLWKEIYETKPKCTNRNDFTALTLVDISPAIFILGTGLGVSLVILVAEVALSRYRSKTRE